MYVKNPFSTVAAVSTPRGKGGIATIRISGSDTVEILEKCFVPKGKPLTERPYRTAVYGEIVNGKDILDTGVCVLYAEGKSFTGELMAELSCHGGLYVTRAVLDAVFASGAEPAGPGEFTKRAFINGKLSLSEAEAVGRLIDADTKSKMELASGAVRGNLTSRLSDIDKKLSDVMIALYAAIDYPEEDVGTEGEDNIYRVVTETLNDVKKLSSTYRTGKAVADGIKTVICGKPNSGKSSIYNSLVGEERAIVTDVAGTTRDTLEDTADVGGITLRLIDTAGIHSTGDKVEKIGIERAYAKMQEAELMICVFDLSLPLGEDEKAFVQESLRCASEKICVLNKSDLERKLSGDDEKYLHDSFKTVVTVSASSPDGTEPLKKAIGSLYNSEKLSPADDALIWDSVQKASLDRTVSLLESAKEALEAGAPLDAVGVVCEEALAQLRMVDGRDVSEDLIAGIFSRFCVGK